MAFRLAEAYVQISQRGVSSVSGMISSLGKRIVGLINPTNLLASAIVTLGTGFGAIGAIKAFGVQEQAENAFGDLLEKIGEGIIKTFNLKGVIKRVTEFLSGLWEKHGGRILDVFNRTIDYIKGLWETLAPAVIPALQSIWQALKVVFSAATQGGSMLVQLLAPIVGMIAGVVKTIADRIKNHKELVVTLSKVAAVVSVVVVGVGVLTAAVGALGAVIGFLTSPIGLAVSALTGLVMLFPDFFKQVTAGLMDVVRNWDLAWRLAWEKTKLFVNNMWERLKTFFQNIPIILKWVWHNWRDIFYTLFDLTTTIFINLGKNIRSFWRALVGFFRGEGFEFDWTPLTEGFKSSIKEWPRLVKANVKETNEAIEKLQREWARRRAAQAKKQGHAEAKAEEEGRRKTTGHRPTPGPTPGLSPTAGGRFELVGLAQLAAKMQQEAGKQLAERQTQATEKTAEATGKLAGAAESGAVRVRVVGGEAAPRAVPAWGIARSAGQRSTRSCASTVSSRNPWAIRAAPGPSSSGVTPRRSGPVISSPSRCSRCGAGSIFTFCSSSTWRRERSTSWA